MTITVARFSPEHLEGFATLFEAAGSGCFCRYWHFTGNKNEWLARVAFNPQANLDEQTAAAREHHPSASGFVAIADPDEEPREQAVSNASCQRVSDGARVIGWVKVAPHEALPKLTSQPVYKHRRVDEKTWHIACFLVHPAHRRAHVATKLVQAAIADLGQQGAHFLEAQPRRCAAELHDEQAWQGPEKLYVNLGFERVSDDPAYPVYRVALPHAPSLRV